MATKQDTIAELPQMNREWRAWRSVCYELGRLNMDLNDHKALARVLERWGEELAALRSGQDPALCARVLIEKRASYPDLRQE